MVHLQIIKTPTGTDILDQKTGKQLKKLDPAQVKSIFHGKKIKDIEVTDHYTYIEINPRTICINGVWYQFP